MLGDVRLLRVLAILAGSAALGLLVLWTVGPHAKPGSGSHWPEVAVFLGVVGLCLVATRRAWDRRVAS